MNKTTIITVRRTNDDTSPSAVLAFSDPFALAVTLKTLRHDERFEVTGKVDSLPTPINSEEATNLIERLLGTDK